MKKPNKNNIQLATFAAGCFWGVEYKFAQLRGIVSTKVGYTGGHYETPTYSDVCSDETGHAEAVQVEFDPRQVSFEKLLDAFWSLHDPTQYHRQGPDVGSQYRSAIFYHSKSQEKAATKSKEKLEKSGRYKKPIVTEIIPAKEFYPAEDYHQKYWLKNKNFVCHI